MDVLFVTPSAVPYPIESGATEACAALAKAVRNAGHRVTVLAPYPEEPDLFLTGLARRLDPLSFELAGKTSQVNVYDGRSAAGVEWILLQHSGLADLFEDGERGLAAQALLARACATLLTRERSFDVVHFHGEETALACAATAAERKARTVFSLYSLASPLRFSKTEAERVGFAALAQEDGSLTPALSALSQARRVTTNAPSRMLDRPAASGIAPLVEGLAGRGADVVAVGGGLDSAVWNPLTDAHIFARYTPVDLSGKARNKAMLQNELKLEIDPDVALLGSIEGAVGAERLLHAAAELVRTDVQLVLQVLDEDAACIDDLIELSQRMPHRLQVRIGDSQKRAHRIVAAADALLLGSDRPLLAMAAQRYGTLPVARRGSLAAEAIVDVDARLSSGNGILYDDRSTPALVAGARRAIAAFNRGLPFDRLRASLMHTDHSWERAARTLDHLYTQLVEDKAA